MTKAKLVYLAFSYPLEGIVKMIPIGPACVTGRSYLLELFYNFPINIYKISLLRLYTDINPIEISL